MTSGPQEAPATSGAAARGELEVVMPIPLTVREAREPERCSTLVPEHAALLDALPHKAWVADPDGSVVHLNTQARQFLGPDADRFLRDGWVSFVHPDDAAAAGRAWAQTVRTEQPQEVVGRLRGGDGSYRWHVGRTAALRDADGRIVQWIGTFSDVHVRHTAALALEESEARAGAQVAQLEALRELLTDGERLAGSGAWALDVETGVFRLSPGTQQLLELEVASVDLPTLLDRIDPEDRDRVGCLDAEAVSGDVPLQVRVASSRGTRTLEIRLAVHHGPADAVVAVTGTAQDISARVAAERAAQLWAEVSEHAPIGLLVLRIDPQTGVLDLQQPVSINRAVDGYEQPTSMLSRLPEDRIRILRAGAAAAVQRGGPVELGEHPLEHAVLGQRIVRTVIYPVPTPHRVVLAGIDVTEQRRLQAERDTLLERSINATEAERRRIAEHLHDEAVQLLTAVRLRLDEACSGSTAAVGREALVPLEAALRALRRTILELAPVELLASGLAEGLRTYSEQLIGPDGPRVEVQVAGGVDTLDPALLQASYRIAQEALTNAHRHAQASRVTIRVGLHGGMLHGEVRDDGRGMAAGTSRRGHLGLRLMRERAEVCDGTLQVERVEPTGTAVRWRLPTGSSLHHDP